MKHIYYLLLSLFLTSCCISKNEANYNNLSKGIIYILPIEVEKRLTLELKRTTGDFCLKLVKIDDLQFKIFLKKTNQNENWAKNTSRFVVISGKPYPLIFDLDNSFAAAETAEEFLNNYTMSGTYNWTSRGVNDDNLFQIHFTIRGKILYEGK